MQDAKNKGRLKSPPLHAGQKCRLAKLTENDVRTIRDVAARGLSQRSIARLFGLPKSTVGNILRGRTWRHLCA